MSSTENQGADDRVRAFFRERLVPLAERLRARGVSFFPMGPDDQAESWYVAYPPGTPEFEAFEGADRLGALAAMWEAEGLHELAALVPALRELAKEFDAPSDDADEVSPFIYAMF